jgi:flagellar biosynthesis/type III secretory pathway ATPase
MFRELFEANFKVGDKVRIKKQYQDSEDDGEFEVIEFNGQRTMIRKLDSKLKIVPTENVKTSMIEKV